MRLLLDAHYSYGRIGIVLEREGHDVRAAVRDPDLRNAADPEVLDAAILDQRILVTADTGHFSVLLAQLAMSGREHFGVVLVPKSIPNDSYGVILRSLRHELADTEQADWINRVIWLSRIHE